MVYTETSKIEEFKKLVSDTLNKMKHEGISEEVFEQLKRRYYGENIKDLNDFETIAFSFVRYYFNKCHFFDIYEMVENCTIEDIKKAMDYLNFEHSSIIECQPINQ